MDRLWIGYWIGGVSALLMAVVNDVAGFPAWATVAAWLTLTPIGMWLATVKPRR